jgi:putrescine aminotransferase
VFDEVYTSWAKTGALFYFMHDNVLPDIVTYAKSFGGGKASISGYTARKGVFERAYGNLQDAILHSTTYNGFGEETITAMEAIRIVVEDGYAERASAIGNRLRDGLEKLQTRHPDLIAEVRGRGALHGIILNPDLGAAIRAALKVVPVDLFKDPRFGAKLLTSAVISELYNRHGVLTFYGDNRDVPLIISPSLVVSDEQIDRFLDALGTTLDSGKLRLLAKFAAQKWGVGTGAA